MLLLLLAACTSPVVRPIDSGTPHDSPVDTVVRDTSTHESADTSLAETRDTAPTEVPGDTAPEPPPGLCTLTLDCAQEIADEPKVPCTLRVEDDQGHTEYDGSAGVELRGRSSIGFPKHQYTVELWDDAGSPVSDDLFGMGGDSDWVINGLYIDRAFLRNKTGFDLYQSWGGPERYAAETAWCTLTLNGTWLGIYLLEEKVKRDDDRVVLQDDTSGTGGSFLLNLEESGGIFDNSTIGYGVWTLVWPDEAEASDDQIKGIQSWLRGWRAALLGSDPANAETGIFAYVDIDAAVDFVLLEELMKNNDAYFLSIYLWKDVDGKMHFTPWDLDLSLGQPTYNNNAVPDQWILYRPTFIDRMTEVPAFKERLVERWWELRADSLSDDALLARIDLAQTTMGDAIYDNYEVWNWNDIYSYWSTLPYVADVDAEFAAIRAWIPERTAWIDANIDAY